MKYTILDVFKHFGAISEDKWPFLAILTVFERFLAILSPFLAFLSVFWHFLAVFLSLESELYACWTL